MLQGGAALLGRLGFQQPLDSGEKQELLGVVEEAGRARHLSLDHALDEKKIVGETLVSSLL